MLGNIYVLSVFPPPMGGCNCVTIRNICFHLALNLHNCNTMLNVKRDNMLFYTSAAQFSPQQNYRVYALLWGIHFLLGHAKWPPLPDCIQYDSPLAESDLMKYANIQICFLLLYEFSTNILFINSSIDV